MKNYDSLQKRVALACIELRGNQHFETVLDWVQRELDYNQEQLAMNPDVFRNHPEIARVAGHISALLNFRQTFNVQLDINKPINSTTGTDKAPGNGSA